VIEIGRVLAARVLAEWNEMEGVESRGVVGEATGSGPDVGVDDGRAEGSVCSVIVPAMRVMMASRTRVTCRGRGQTRRTRWTFVGSLASGYRSGRVSIVSRSDWHVRLRCGNRCCGTGADPAGRAAGSVGPKTEGYILSFCHFAFHFLCDLPSHLEVSQTWIGLDLGFTATDKRRRAKARHRLMAYAPAATPGLTQDRCTQAFSPPGKGPTASRSRPRASGAYLVASLRPRGAYLVPPLHARPALIDHP
jgi:hypothetical protein